MTESKKKRTLEFKRKDYEKNAELYARGQQFVGAVDKRNKRYIALAELEQKLRAGKHVQNRALDTHLTAKQYAAYEAASEQQKLMRSGSKLKPQAIKHYEAELNRVQLQDVKAKDLRKRGHDEGAAATEELCKSQMQDLLTDLRAAVSADPALTQWLDRTIPEADAALSTDDMPRSITSNSKSCRVERKSPAQIKLDAVSAAMRELE
ncbi:hypothetical protein [Roseicyclus sp.]